MWCQRSVSPPFSRFPPFLFRRGFFGKSKVSENAHSRLAENYYHCRRHAKRERKNICGLEVRRTHSERCQLEQLLWFPQLSPSFAFFYFFSSSFCGKLTAAGLPEVHPDELYHVWLEQVDVPPGRLPAAAPLGGPCHDAGLPALLSQGTACKNCKSLSSLSK